MSATNICDYHAERTDSAIMNSAIKYPDCEHDMPTTSSDWVCPVCGPRIVTRRFQLTAAQAHRTGALEGLWVRGVYLKRRPMMFIRIFCVETRANGSWCFGDEVASRVSREVGQ